MKYDSICLMLPTYGRASTLLPVFIGSAIRQAGFLPNIKFCFCVNKNDTDTQNYLNQYPFPATVEWEMMIEDLIQPNLAKYFNMMYDKTKFNRDETLVTMVGDDMEFITHGWDERILEEVNKYSGIGVFWCNDDYIAKSRLCVNLFVSRKFVQATRKPFMCPLFPADMIDVVWMEVGVRSNTGHYLSQVIIKHNHNSKKVYDQQDETFRRISPLQKSASTKFNTGKAMAYATMVVANLIEEGMGKWE